MKHILSGNVFPELQDEIDRMRVRKSELEDIISRSQTSDKKVDKDKIVELFKNSIENWDADRKDIINCHITKIYANTDGSYTANVGVHIIGCGGRI